VTGDDDEYVVGFLFELSFEGEDAAFKEVSGISKELGIEEVRSGGENRFKYRLPTLVTSKNLILKRGIIDAESQLISWCSDTLDNGFGTSIETHDVSVNLLNSDGEVLIKWTFYNAYPVKYSVSDLKSQESEVLIETIELAYTYFDV
jgi:phage tail-like protein